MADVVPQLRLLDYYNLNEPYSRWPFLIQNCHRWWYCFNESSLCLMNINNLCNIAIQTKISSLWSLLSLYALWIQLRYKLSIYVRIICQNSIVQLIIKKFASSFLFLLFYECLWLIQHKHLRMIKKHFHDNWNLYILYFHMFIKYVNI